METELKYKGLWEVYQAKIQNTDIDNFIKDYTNFIMNKLDESNMGFVTEAGDVERWKGSIDKVQSSFQLRQNYRISRVFQEVNIFITKYPYE